MFTNCPHCLRHRKELESRLKLKDEISKRVVGCMMSTMNSLSRREKSVNVVFG